VNDRAGASGSATSGGALIRIALRPLGNPLPLGFLALAAGTSVLAGLQLGWFAEAEGRNVALILLAFVFPLQLLASIFGFLSRDVVAGTGMGVLAGTWLSIALVTLASPAGSTSAALGLLLLVSMVAMLVPALVAAAGKLIASAVLGTAGLRFGITGVYELSALEGWQDLAGVVGLALAALAIYAALAMALEDARRRTVLPLLRRGSGRASMEEGLSAQVDRIEHEAGIREQL